jgi:flagellar basal-body rod modification protein FlgD
VRRMPLPATEGLSDFSWDGLADSGARAPIGRYTFEAVASIGGQNSSLETLLTDRVNSVTIDSSHGLTLNTRGLGAHALSNVRRVM